MGTAERKEREKQQRRLNIIDASEKVFLTKGFDQTTMDDIAEQAELSKGTLYLYFKSKEELYAEIIKRGEKILANLFKKAVKKEKNGLCKVRGIGKAFIKFFNIHKEYHEALLFGHSRTHTTNETSCNDCKNVGESNQVFVDAIEEGINDGSIRNNVDPLKTSLLLWAQLMGVMQMIQVQGTFLKDYYKTSSEDLLAYFFEYTYNALKA
ncbi:MAG: TetR/AcrR family transcriptional regulator [Melioribacteraceae bacterium]